MRGKLVERWNCARNAVISGALYVTDFPFLIRTLQGAYFAALPLTASGGYTVNGELQHNQIPLLISGTPLLLRKGEIKRSRLV